MRLYFLVAHNLEIVFFSAFTRFSVSYIPIYVNCVSDEGRSEALHLSDRANKQSSEAYQRHAS